MSCCLQDKPAVHGATGSGVPDGQQEKPGAEATLLQQLQEARSWLKDRDLDETWEQVQKAEQIAMQALSVPGTSTGQLRRVLQVSMLLEEAISNQVEMLRREDSPLQGSADPDEDLEDSVELLEDYELDWEIDCLIEQSNGLLEEAIQHEQQITCQKLEPAPALDEQAVREGAPIAAGSSMPDARRVYPGAESKLEQDLREASWLQQCGLLEDAHALLQNAEEIHAEQQHLLDEGGCILQKAIWNEEKILSIRDSLQLQTDTQGNEPCVLNEESKTKKRAELRILICKNIDLLQEHDVQLHKGIQHEQRIALKKPQALSASETQALLERSIGEKDGLLRERDAQLQKAQRSEERLQYEMVDLVIDKDRLVQEATQHEQQMSQEKSITASLLEEQALLQKSIREKDCLLGVSDAQLQKALRTEEQLLFERYDLAVDKGILVEEAKQHAARLQEKDELLQCEREDMEVLLAERNAQRVRLGALRGDIRHIQEQQGPLRITQEVLKESNTRIDNLLQERDSLLRGIKILADQLKSRAGSTIWQAPSPVSDSSPEQHASGGSHEQADQASQPDLLQPAMASELIPQESVPSPDSELHMPEAPLEGESEPYGGETHPHGGDPAVQRLAGAQFLSHETAAARTEQEVPAIDEAAGQQAAEEMDGTTRHHSAFKPASRASTAETEDAARALESAQQQVLGQVAGPNLASVVFESLSQQAAQQATGSALDKSAVEPADLASTAETEQASFKLDSVRQQAAQQAAGSALHKSAVNPADMASAIENEEASSGLESAGQQAAEEVDGAALHDTAVEPAATAFNESAQQVVEQVDVSALQGCAVEPAATASIAGTAHAAPTLYSAQQQGATQVSGAAQQKSAMVSAAPAVQAAPTLQSARQQAAGQAAGAALHKPAAQPSSAASSNVEVFWPDEQIPENPQAAPDAASSDTSAPATAAASALHKAAAQPASAASSNVEVFWSDDQNPQNSQAAPDAASSDTTSPATASETASESLDHNGSRLDSSSPFGTQESASPQMAESQLQAARQVAAKSVAGAALHIAASRPAATAAAAETDTRDVEVTWLDRNSFRSQAPDSVQEQMGAASADEGLLNALSGSSSEAEIWAAQQPAEPDLAAAATSIRRDQPPPASVAADNDSSVRINQQPAETKPQESGNKEAGTEDGSERRWVFFEAETTDSAAQQAARLAEQSAWDHVEAAKAAARQLAQQAEADSIAANLLAKNAAMAGVRDAMNALPAMGPRLDWSGKRNKGFSV